MYIASLRNNKLDNILKIEIKTLHLYFSVATAPVRHFEQIRSDIILWNPNVTLISLPY